MLDIVLGQEFLTWLWFRHEQLPLGFKDQNGKPFHIALEQRVVVQGGEGDSKETTSFSGASYDEIGTDGVHLSMREARLGLRTGKKVTRALLRFEQEELVWFVTIKADDFALGSLRTPKVEHEADDDPDAVFLEKIYLMERAQNLFDMAYKTFLELRLDNRAWNEEMQAIGAWMTRQE